MSLQAEISCAFGLAMLNKSAQSDFDCGSEAAALNPSKKAVASLTVL